MTKIYSYVLLRDNGAAPNPFWECCTLVICKPAIRRTAEIGDWIIGTGSKNTILKDGNTYDFSDRVVYAMKVTDKKTLEEYNEFCKNEIPNKIPKWKTEDWRLLLGDCIYDFSINNHPTQRKGVHQERHIKRDLGGRNALLSNHFYYFGTNAKTLPEALKALIKKSQGHRKIENPDLITRFEEWIEQFERNKLFGEPQMKWKFDKTLSNEEVSDCVAEVLENEEDDKEEIVC